MSETAIKRVKLSDRINSIVGSEAPIRQLAGNWSKTAKVALDEANSLSLERVEIKLKRLPQKLDGLKIIHLSDTHHSPFTNLDHIARAVKVANRLRPDIVALLGDYVARHLDHAAIVASGVERLQAPLGVVGVLGPTRLPYWRAVPMVRFMAQLMDVVNSRPGL